MRVVGIIAEYDPFHNGHAYHLKKAVEMTGAQAAVAVISGSFTQRGSAAFYDKGARTAAALAAGADLVLELPHIYACNAGAEFAYGAMAVLEGTGVVTDLIFGSECGDISLLKEAAEISAAGRSEEYGVSDTGREIGRGDGGAGQGTGREAGGGILEKEEGTETENRGEGKDQEGRKFLLSREIQKRIRAGLSYPAAFGQAVSEVWGSAAGNVFQNPNDVLGIGYLSALKNLGSKIEPHCIARTGAGHRERRTGDADIQTKFAGSGSIASGTALRKLIREKGIGAAADYLPEEVLRIFQGSSPFPGDENLYPFLRYRLLTAEESRLREIYSVTEGIENRMKAAALVSDSYPEYMRAVKTRRYTWAQIQRMNLHVLMDFTQEQYRRLRGVSYARVLGFSAEGSKLLRRMRKEGSAEIISNLSGISNLKPRTEEALRIEMKASNLRNLFLKRSLSEFSERKFVPLKGLQ